MKHVLSNVMRWIVNRLSRIPERDNRYTAWLILAFFIATMIPAIIHALGNPTGASLSAHAIDIGKAITMNSFLFIIGTFMLGAIFSFIYLPLPRLTLGSFIYTVIISVAILLLDSSGTLFSYIIGIAYSLAAVFVGLFFILFVYKRNARIIMLVVLLAGGSIYIIMDKIGNQQEAIPVFADYTEPVLDENPAEIGNYDYTFFTYGSGEDLHREKFGEAVDQITPAVDASHFITKWGKKRETFWGFTPSNLPVNGRVWMPEGEGPFPVILMVHGNHTMEYFSTGGYDYLGELLASRGFIGISVDEDFINYSNVSGSPNDNYELRAWMILQHLTQLQDMNESEETAFYNKIDFDHVGLMGHSRGGQAVAMAADYTRFFEDDELFHKMESIHIKGVVAIAPTDKTVNDKKPRLHNVSYLLLHGARDADVRDFRGNRQYDRTTFDPDYDGFKTTLYIAGANHTQFNTDWGKMDLSLPRGLFLNQKQTLAAEDQQQIAKVYMSAFFESIFHGQSSYNKLFQDYRYGKNWLPETVLVNKYQDPTYQPIVQFQREGTDMNMAELFGFKKWEISTPKYRTGGNHASDSLQLEWETEATYSVNLAKSDLQTGAQQTPERIVLTMANIDNEADSLQVPHIEIELETVTGEAVRLPLDDFMPFPPVISTDYTHFGLFDNLFREGNYEKSWEPIFQTFEVPIEAFEEKDTAFEKNDISKITLHFKPQPGKILLEQIGVW